jgi:hypothetical protein
MRDASRLHVKRTRVAALVCLLVAALTVTVVHHSYGHPHALRGNAVTVTSVADPPHFTPRAEHDDVPVYRLPTAAHPAAAGATAHTDRILAAFTVDSLPVRGPPGQDLA